MSADPEGVLLSVVSPPRETEVGRTTPASRVGHAGDCGCTRRGPCCCLQAQTPPARPRLSMAARARALPTGPARSQIRLDRSHPSFWSPRTHRGARPRPRPGPVPLTEQVPDIPWCPQGDFGAALLFQRSQPESVSCPSPPPHLAWAPSHPQIVPPVRHPGPPHTGTVHGGPARRPRRAAIGAWGRTDRSSASSAPDGRTDRRTDGRPQFPRENRPI